MWGQDVGLSPERKKHEGSCALVRGWFVGLGVGCARGKEALVSWAEGAEEVRALDRLGLRAMFAAAGLALLLGQVRGEGVAGPVWKWSGLLSFGLSCFGFASLFPF